MLRVGGRLERGGGLHGTAALSGRRSAREHEPYDLIEGATGPWEVVVGLEVHAQVTSQAKLFSRRRHRVRRARRTRRSRRSMPACRACCR